jgi:hypothetical protein
MLNWDNHAIPEHTKYALTQYIENGIPTGDFLRCVLCNDFVGAVSRADSDNSRALRDIATWLYNQAPEACWGTEAKVLRWLETHPRRTKIGPKEV